MKTQLSSLLLLLAATSFSARATEMDCVVPPEGIVAWWPGESNLWDVAGEFDASISYYPTMLYAPGMVGTAIQIQPPSSLIVRDAPELNVGGGEGFTFESWIKPNSVLGLYGIFGWGGSGSGLPPSPTGVNLRIVPPGLLEAQLITTNNQLTLLRTQAPVLQASQWQHVALSYDKVSGVAAIYVNGTAVAQTNIGSVGLRTSGYLQLGAASGVYYYGLMDEPSLYNRSLSPAELAAVFHADLSGKCPPPPPPCLKLPDIVAFWQGDSNTLDVVAGNNGVAVPTNFPFGATYQSGLSGGAFRFNNANSITVPKSDSLNVGAADGMTVEGWVYQSSPTGPIVEWSDANNTGTYLAFSYSYPNALEANLIDTTNGIHYLRSTSPSYSLNYWRHIALTYDKASGLASLYDNGYLVATTNMGTFTPRTDGDLLIGYHPPYTGPYYYGSPPTSERRLSGAIDELAIYRRALSAEEIRALVRRRASRCMEFPAAIGRQPQDEIVLESGAAEMAASTGGAGPLSYQWFHGDTLLPQANGPVLRWPSVRMADAGGYTLVVSNAFGSVTSRVATLTVLPANECFPPPSNAVAWWRGENSGRDDLGFSDMVWQIPSRPEFTNGLVGEAFRFNGSSYLQTAANASLDVGRGDGFTVEGWIRPESTSYMPIVEWNDRVGNIGVGIMLNRTGLGTIEATLTDTNAINYANRVVTFASPAGVVGSQASPLPGWTHIALTYDKASGRADLLVNAQVVATRIIAPILTRSSPQVPVSFTPATAFDLYFGYRPSGSYGGSRFRGAMDEFTVYGRALNLDELRSIFVVGANGKCALALECLKLPGMVAFWQGESNALDLVSGNNGIIIPTNYAPAATYEMGRVGTAFAFRGNNFVSVPQSDNLDVGRAEGLTIEGWVNPRIPFGPIVEWTDTNNFGVFMTIGYFSGFSLEANLIDSIGNFHLIRSSPAVLTPNMWQHVALSYDKASGIASLYLNGGAIATTNLGSFNPRTDLDLLIGYHPRYTGSPVAGGPLPYDRYFNGAIDELAIYRRALTHAEIRERARPIPTLCMEFPAAISRGPEDEVVSEGGAVTLTVAAGGSAPLHYQWFRNGMALAGGTHSSLPIPSAGVHNAGEYQVVISNLFGMVTSRVAGVTVLPANQCLPTPVGAVAFWRGESNTLDELGNHPATWTNITSAYAPGEVNTAFRFTGVNYLTVPADPELNVGAGGGFTVEGWIKPDFFNGGQPIVDWNDGQGNVGVGLIYARTSPGSLEVTLTDTNAIGSPTERIVTFSTGPYAIGSPAKPQPDWTHVALTFDRALGTATVFVNGESVLTRTIGQVLGYSDRTQRIPFTPTTTGDLYFGWRRSGQYAGPRFRGAMDEMAVYYRALTPLEVKSIYVVGANGKCAPQPSCLPVMPDVVSWWRGESNLLDSVNTNNGSQSPAGPPGIQKYINGVQGQGFSFPPGYVRIRASSSLDVGAQSGMTFEAWINPDSFGGYGLAGWATLGGTPGVSLGTSLTRGPDYFDVDLMDTLGNSHIMTTPFRTLAYSNWQHLAVTYDKPSGLGVIYVNGAPVVVTNLGSFTPWTTGELYLGRRPLSAGSYRPYYGGLDEVLLHNRALSSGEISVSYHNTANRCMEPPVIVQQPQPASIRVNAGSDVTLSALAVGNPVLRYQWFRNGKPILARNQQPSPEALLPNLVLTNIAAFEEGYYHVVVSNAFGMATSSNALLLVNYPPVANASNTITLLISANGQDALAVLDGSLSRDPDQDPLEYEWFVGDASTALATGAVAVVTLPIGENPITLVVSDGLLEATNRIVVEVLTTSQATERLLALVENQTDRPQPLAATLQTVLASIERSQVGAAVNQLQAFQNKVQAQVAPSNPALAAELIAAAQAIIDALNGTSGGAAQSIKIASITRAANGKSHLKIQGRTGRTLIVETSNDGVNWRKVGVATDRGADQYEFDDIADSGAEMRFYRVVSPK